tara:strand:- start:2020 stop:4200 length:2181 start_codon:yes stop_codon:yes gene_type:complete
MINNSDYKEYKAMMMALSNIPGNRGNYTFEDFKKQKADTELRQKLTPEIKENINKGDLEEAYKSYEQLPLGDMLSYEISPGMGDAISGYEIAEFGRRGKKAKEEGRYLDAAGNFLISGLNTAGTAATLIPPLAYGLDAADVAVKGIGKYLRKSGGDGPVETKVNVAPGPMPLKHEIVNSADRQPEIMNNQASYRYSENDTQMMSQIALAESDLYKYPNKEYPLENIFQSMRRYGVEGKGNVNQNVKRQIEDFVSPEFIESTGGKATPADVMREIQKNSPEIKEHHAYYNLNSVDDPGIRSGYSDYRTKRPVYDLDSELTTYKEATETTSPSYGERSYSMYDKDRIYGQPQTPDNPGARSSFESTNHDVGRGQLISGSDTNKYMHQRYTLETIDGNEKVLVMQELQSDPYTFTKDQDKLARRLDTGAENPVQDVPYMFRYAEENGILAGIANGERRTTEMVRTELPKFYEYLVGTNKADAFDKELGESYKSLKNDLEQLEIETGYNRKTMQNYDMYNSLREELEDTFYQQTQRKVENYMSGFSEYLGVSGGLTPKNLPRSADWFTDSVKTGLQTASINDSPFILIPNGPRSLAPPSGNSGLIPPKLAPRVIEKFGDNPNYKLNYDTKGELLNVQEITASGNYNMIMSTEPDEKSINRAKTYNDFLKKALKQTEQDYKIKLNANPYEDQYGQEYLRIDLTPELKDAFKTFKMNQGGHVNTIMPLKYDL